MINKIKNMFFKGDESINITDQNVIDSFIKKPDFPWLISFPRTGSHWLRMMMELYFEKPSLVRIFYFKDAKDFTCYHRHDEHLKVESINNVLYIYRNPVDTIFSLLQYYKEDLSDIHRIRFWTEQYADHLNKWLIEENFTQKKVIITYEELKNNLHEEFRKITDFFETEFNPVKLEDAAGKISRKELKKKTPDNSQIVNIRSNYEDQRKYFQNKYAEQIKETIFLKHSKLGKLTNYPIIFD